MWFLVRTWTHYQCLISITCYWLYRRGVHIAFTVHGSFDPAIKRDTELEEKPRGERQAHLQEESIMQGKI